MIDIAKILTVLAFCLFGGYLLALAGHPTSLWFWSDVLGVL